MGALAGFSEEAGALSAGLKNFLHRWLYNHPALAEERDRGVAWLEALFRYYLEHPKQTPPYHAALAEEQPRHRVVCDYIAGMTDRFLAQEHERLLG